MQLSYLITLTFKFEIFDSLFNVFCLIVKKPPKDDGHEKPKAKQTRMRINTKHQKRRRNIWLFEGERK